METGSGALLSLKLSPAPARGVAPQVFATPRGRCRIGLRLSQQELGNLIAATRESVNKHLRLWEAKGLIGAEQGWITLHDRGALEVLAGADGELADFGTAVKQLTASGDSFS